MSGRPMAMGAVCGRSGVAKPLAIDLFAGLGGWAEGCLAEGYDVIGFDIERHVYGEHRYPGLLVIQDVLTLHGSQFKDAALIVASPPCQAFSYMAMPWSTAKAKAAAIRADTTGAARAELTQLFDACFRIQREACEAAGRHIPLIVENVRGAQPWVGKARWNFGSFYLFGDVPALMPIVKAFKSKGMDWSDRTKRGQDFTGVAGRQAMDGVKQHGSGAAWFDDALNERRKAATAEGRKAGTQAERGMKVPSAEGRRTDVGKGARFTSRDCGVEGTKVSGDWFGSYGDMKAAGTISPGRMHGKGPRQRAFASALIAKIPTPLSRWIAATYRP